MRDPAKLPADHKASKVVVGNVLNKDDVMKTMEGQDAVIIILGTGKDISKATDNKNITSLVYYHKHWILIYLHDPIYKTHIFCSEFVIIKMQRYWILILSAYLDQKYSTWFVIFVHCISLYVNDSIL